MFTTYKEMSEMVDELKMECSSCLKKFNGVEHCFGCSIYEEIEYIESGQLEKDEEEEFIRINPDNLY